MNERSSPLPDPRSATAGETTLCAALVLDSTGKVVATNESARQLWAAPDRSLVGTPVSDLLLTERTASDAISAHLSWKTFSTAALNQWAAFVAQPHNGPPRAVRIRLERAVGGAGSYIAVVVPE